MRGFCQVTALCGIFLYIAGCTKKSNDSSSPEPPAQPPPSETPTDSPDDSDPNGSDNTSAHVPNSREPTVEEPSPILFGAKTLHILYTTGESPERRQLLYAKRTTDTPWTQTLVARSNDNEQIFGRSTLRLDVTGPIISLIKHVSTNLERPRLEFQVASRSQGGAFKFRQLWSGDRPMASSLTGAVAPLRRGKVAIATLSNVDGSHTTTAIDFSAQDPYRPESRLVLDSGPGPVTDAAVVLDRKGRSQIAFIKETRLQVASTGDDGQLEVTKIDLAKCSDVRFVAMDSAPDGTFYILHACTFNPSNQDTGDDLSCRLGLTTGKSFNNMTTTELSVIDPKHGCGSFATDRPSLAVDRDGGAHIAFRFRQNMETQWHIGYIAVRDGSPAQVRNMDTSGETFGYAHVAVDGKNRAHVAWMSGDKLKVASSEDDGLFHTETVAFPEENAGGTPLTFSDFTVTGGL